MPGAKKKAMRRMRGGGMTKAKLPMKGTNGTSQAVKVKVIRIRNMLRIGYSL